MNTAKAWLFFALLLTSLICVLSVPYKLSGPVSDCCLDFETVDEQNSNLFPLLQNLTKYRFFRIFKVNLYSPCKFWTDDGMCEREDCSVCECDRDEIPSLWAAQDKLQLPQMDDKCEKEVSDSGDVDQTEEKPPTTRWKDVEENLWIVQEQEAHDIVYVNLQRNPEKYTGYGGYTATRIWHAIYKENCFSSGNSELAREQCLEERVFYRLISGLHGSITAHIARAYCKDSQSAPNVELFHYRLGTKPEYLSNVYFTFVFLVRAASKAADLLHDYPIVTGNNEEDSQAKQQLLKVLQNPMFHELDTFRETSLFASPDKAELKKQFQSKFRNISLIMNCVQCEKCRMWGKLQVMGLGTAMKILFASSPLEIAQLERNELIAFINTLAKFSTSIDTVRLMNELATERQPSTLTSAPPFPRPLSNPFDDSSSDSDLQILETLLHSPNLARVGLGVVAVLGVLVAAARRKSGKPKQKTS